MRKAFSVLLILAGLPLLLVSCSCEKKDALMEKAIAEFQKRPALSIEMFNQVIKKQPRYAAAYFFRGAAYSALGRHDKAVADYTKTLELEPRYANVYWSRGYSYANSDKYAEAVQDYTESLRRDDPKYRPMVLEMRAKVYYQMGELKKAAADLREILKTDPQNAVALQGLELIKQGPPKKWDEKTAWEEAAKKMQAKIDLSKVAKVDPDYRENKAALRSSTDGRVLIHGRFITPGATLGEYLVSYMNKNGVPDRTIFYGEGGRALHVRSFSADNFPRAAYTYCMDECERYGKKYPAGALSSVSFHPNQREYFYFTAEGKLVDYKKNA